MATNSSCFDSLFNCRCLELTVRFELFETSEEKKSCMNHNRWFSCTNFSLKKIVSVRFECTWNACRAAVELQLVCLHTVYGIISTHYCCCCFAVSRKKDDLATIHYSVCVCVCVSALIFHIFVFRCLPFCVINKFTQIICFLVYHFGFRLGLECYNFLINCISM